MSAILGSYARINRCDIVVVGKKMPFQTVRRLINRLAVFVTFFSNKQKIKGEEEKMKNKIFEITLLIITVVSGSVMMFILWNSQVTIPRRNARMMPMHSNSHEIMRCEGVFDKYQRVVFMVDGKLYVEVLRPIWTSYNTQTGQQRLRRLTPYNIAQEGLTGRRDNPISYLLSEDMIIIPKNEGNNVSRVDIERFRGIHTVHEYCRVTGTKILNEGGQV